MSCILRVSGAELDVDTLISIVDLKPDRIWRRGEPSRASKPEGKRYDHSGATFVASVADFGEFGQQLDAATSYLEIQCRQIASMASFDDVQDATLDFGIELRNVAVHHDVLPFRFLKATGSLSVALSVARTT